MGGMTFGGWRKSRRSFANGDCLEAGNWRTSGRSSVNGQCLEAGSCSCGVAVRDSRDRGGPVLTFAGPAWRVFLAAVKAGAS
jgi:hypothetical protein